MSEAQVKKWFDSGIETGWIGIYEKEMIRFMEKEFGALGDEIKMCAVFTSLFIKAGHTCLPLNYSPAQWAEILDLDSEINLPDTLLDQTIIQESGIVGVNGEMKPMILSGNRLIFRRYFYYEDDVQQWIKNKISNISNEKIDLKTNQILDELFPQYSGKTDWQKVATALSLFKPFLIISGGPGTGKTTTIARILVLQQRLSERPLNVALVAPTGKAASRMGEALHRELVNLGLKEVELRHFPKEAKTVHRLLSGTEERGLLPLEEKKILRQDLIIIDEASMMDLNLMYRLVSHLSEKTKLILLGDKDQLASVEAGAVFADLCRKRENGFQTETAEKLANLGIVEALPVHEQSGIDDSIVYLTKSYRFDSESGIGKLAEIVRKTDHQKEDVKSVFHDHNDVVYQEFDYQKEDLNGILESMKGKINQSSNKSDPGELLDFWKESIWLMVLRHGLTGTERLNRLIEEQLAAERIVQMENGWYHGRPIIITQNDYNLGIYNGDLGVCVVDKNGSLLVYVETGSELRRVKPRRLFHYDPAFFLTVHKSQGSEFDHVHFLLPQTDTPILTKELIYTAITRAKKRFSLYGNLELFKKGMNRETRRFTGLKEVSF